MNEKDDPRDQELDGLLAPFRKSEPSPAQIALWQSAVQSARDSKQRRWYQLRLVALPQLVAAVMLGFVIGALTFHMKAQKQIQIAENYEPNATIEHIYANAN